MIDAVSKLRSFRRGDLGLSVFLIGLASLVILVAAVLPLGALVYQGVSGIRSPVDGAAAFFPSWPLLWRSMGLAAGAALLTTLVSIPGAIGFATSDGRRNEALPVFMGAIVLLTPSMVLAFAWQGLAPGTVPGWLMTLATWTLWAWPIPAAIIGACWRSDVRPFLDAARMDAARLPTAVRIALPLLARSVATSAIILFLIFFNDYGVPHAFGITVFATDVLASAEASSSIHGPLQASLPSVAVALAALAAVAVRLGSGQRTLLPELNANTKSSDRGNRWPLVVLFCVSWLVPMFALTTRVGSVGAFSEAVRTYGPDLTVSLAIAAVAGLLAALSALGLALFGGWARRAGIILLFATGALPAALLCGGILAVYNHVVLSTLIDHWPATGLAHLSRFGWVCGLIALLMSRRGGDDLLDQAQCDGASNATAFLRVALPRHRRLLIASGAIVAALAVGDAAGTSLLRSPDFSPICLVIIEKFHRFEDAMLTSLSLCLAVVGALAAAALAWARCGSATAE